MNALAHCAEALYAQGHNPAADDHALAGARIISEWLPRVVSAPRDLESRTELLRGACHGGAALAGSTLALAHAIGTGDRRTLRAPARDPERDLPASRAPLQHRLRAGRGHSLGEAVGAPGDTAGRVEELACACRPDPAPRARHSGGGPARAGARHSPARRQRRNPKPATPDEIERLLRAVFARADPQPRIRGVASQELDLRLLSFRLANGTEGPLRLHLENLVRTVAHTRRVRQADTAVPDRRMLRRHYRPGCRRSSLRERPLRSRS